jgi:hypothetical protein
MKRLGWRSLGESNPCFSLESAKSIRSVTLSVSSVAFGVERTYRRQPISVANDLGCVKNVIASGTIKRGATVLYARHGRL